MHQKQRIEVDITRAELRTIIRNLRGLTRSQTEQIIIECVAEDRRFDADDINTVLAGKRRALHAGGLLEYVQTPVDLSEIGGLRRLKRWLKQRQEAVTDQAVDFLQFTFTFNTKLCERECFQPGEGDLLITFDTNSICAIIYTG